MPGDGEGAKTSPPRRVLPLLLVGYAAFYLCRANVEPALNLLAIEHGYDNEQLGLVMGIALGAYAVGKLVFGPLADLLGGKRVLVGALLGTALVSLAIAASDAPRRFGPSATADPGGDPRGQGSTEDRQIGMSP